MRFLICDDDQMICSCLQKYIKEYFRANHIFAPKIAIYNDGEELLKDQGEKSIVFLDVELDGASGLSVGKQLMQDNKNIIIFIVTSYNDYLDDAMDIHVFRFLTKPIEKQRFFKNLDQAINYYNIHDKKIAVKTKKNVYTLQMADVICVEARQNKVTVYTVQGAYAAVEHMNIGRRICVWDVLSAPTEAILLIWSLLRNSIRMKSY